MHNESDRSKESTLKQVDKWQAAYLDLNIIPVTTHEDVNDIILDEVVVIFHATWSSYSYTSISMILEKLDSLHAKKNIYIVNIDGVSSDFVATILGHLGHGYGEAAYLSKGKAICTYSHKHTIAPFLDCLSFHIRD